MYVEGAARIGYAAGAFLNPKGRASRDISVAYLRARQRDGASLLDATAATGIRAIRYWKECGIRDATAIEINREAFSSLKRNIKANRTGVRPLNQSIQEFANTSGERFDFIDLDPFGGVSPYIYDLMKLSKHGTELMVTATDTAVLCGADRDACIRLYDSKPVHNELSHEGAIRVLIGYIARVAAQFNMGVEPMLSFSHMHYMRVFIRLSHGSSSVKGSLSQLGYLGYCQGCGSRVIEPGQIPRRHRCGTCRREMGAYGKMWLGRIKEQRCAESVAGALSGAGDAEALARLIASELDLPFYYHIPTMTRMLGVGAVSPASVSALLERSGHRTSYTHMLRSSIRSDADAKAVRTCIRRISRSRNGITEALFR